jgi:hypothetical protein
MKVEKLLNLKDLTVLKIFSEVKIPVRNRLAPFVTALLED